MFKQRLNDGERLFGSWVQAGHPANAEVLARAGNAWLALDLEHGDAHEESVPDFCRAARAHGAAPLVRVRANDTLAIRRALDLGADGVIVPLVDSAADAARAVAGAHYPPKGVRGFAWHQGNGWGMDFDRYAKDFAPVVVVMVESRAAVEAVDELVAVDGVDGVLIGPYDLSGSYGIVGQTGHPLVLDATAKVAAACRQHGKAAGQHIVTPTAENVAHALALGYTFLALGMDTFFMAEGARRALALAQ